MLVRVISDLHIDINNGIDWENRFNPDTFYIIAGDISGSYKRTAEFVKQNIKRGVFVAGNHLGYDSEPLDEGLKYLRSNFNKGTVRFLNNNIYRIGKTVFIGCTLYTDFELFGNPDLGMRASWEVMNDFRYVKYHDKEGKIRTLSPQKTLEWHNESLRYLRDKLEHYKDCKVVIVTHHAPSIRSVSERYRYDQVSSAYASNLESLMYDYSNIVLWCCGHCHNKVNYRINKTRVVCNPYGYYNENLMDLKDLGVEINV